MTSSTKLDEKLERAENSRAWKYRIMLILEENDLDGLVENEVQEPEGYEARARHKKDMIRANRIIVDSIKDHLIPQVSSKKTLKEMFDALSEMFEGRNINWKMTLRSQLKNVKMEKEESMPSYFSRVFQIKKLLEANRDKVEDVEVVMTTLNGFPRQWDSFIQGICT